MELIERKTIFKDFPKIAALISDLQNHFYDEDDDLNNPAFDNLELGKNASIYHKGYVFMLPHHTISSYPKTLTKHLHSLLSEFDCEGFILISFIRSDLFGNTKHTDKEILDARRTLQKFTNSKSYTEAFSFPVTEMESLISSFFWLSRLDPDLTEYIFWIDNKERFYFYICKRGNIHFSSLEKNINLSEELLQQNGFLPNRDDDQF